MRKSLKAKIEELISEGQAYTFQNNSRLDPFTNKFYSFASDDYIIWYSQVEALIYQNYSENNPAYITICSVKKNHFKGYEEWYFDNEILKIKNSLQLAKESNPDKNKRTFTSSILLLLSNEYFWSTIIILIPGAFYLGIYFGETRYDESKISMSKQIDTLNKKIFILEKELDSNSSKKNMIIQHK